MSLNRDTWGDSVLLLMCGPEPENIMNLCRAETRTWTSVRFPCLLKVVLLKLNFSGEQDAGKQN